MWSIKSVSILVCLPFTIDEVDTTKTTNQPTAPIPATFMKPRPLWSAGNFGVLILMKR